MAVMALVLAAGCSGGEGREPVEPKPEPVEGAPPPSPHADGTVPGVTGEPRVGEREPSPSPAPAPAPLAPYSPWIAPPVYGPPGGMATPVLTAPSTGISVKWKAEIGVTTYKSTIHYHDGRIIVGSNGSSWKDSQDARDGLYILDPADGSIDLQFVPPGTGEKDVNGVALGKDLIFLGTDQDNLYAVDWTGSVKWQTTLVGDVEAAPALADLDGDGKLDVAVGSEGGVMYGIGGKKGKTLWSVKATAGYYNSPAFVGAAALGDVTGDGIADVFVPSRDAVFRAIDGKTGKLLWSHQGGSGMHGAPILVDADGDGQLEVIFTESYSEVRSADASTGVIEWHVELTNPDGGIEGLFGPVGWYPEAGCALVSTAWWAASEGVYCLAGTSGAMLWRYNESKGNISSGAVVGDVDGQPGSEAVFGTESGKLVAVDTSGVPVRMYELGGAIECTPTLADIDGDGLVEILVASNDGFIRALETDGVAPPVIGYHRGDSHNAAVF